MRTRIVTCGLVALLTFLHILYLWGGGLYLYEKTGGVTTEGKWTAFGSATHAWTIPIVLPGTLVMLAQEKTGGAGNPESVQHGTLGFLMVVIGEIVASYALASVIVCLFTGRDFPWGRFRWKAILIALGLIWIPVPESWAFVYQYTVMY